ncbi:MAG: Uncharacterised protein [Flavobacteriia bacterium]|nr:MAG: Uncharacterised protein [Flavobacteriia bacterium]
MEIDHHGAVHHIVHHGVCHVHIRVQWNDLWASKSSGYIGTEVHAIDHVLSDHNIVVIEDVINISHLCQQSQGQCKQNSKRKE